jgi:hypothetical protein
MRRYVAGQKKVHKVLDQTEYLSELFAWAREYFGGEFDVTVQERMSIAGACADKMNKRAPIARIKNFVAR